MRRERVQIWLAVLGASATILAGLIPSVLQLVARSGDRPARWVSCSFAVERVVELEQAHPKLADLYGRSAEYLPRLFNGVEEEECGDPRYLVEQLGRRDAAPQLTGGRDTSRR